MEKGEKVEKGDHLVITEAMKMETTVQAPFSGVVKDIYVQNGEAIQTGDLLIELEINKNKKRDTVVSCISFCLSFLNSRIVVSILDESCRYSTCLIV